jgi:hypothetical protein
MLSAVLVAVAAALASKRVRTIGRECLLHPRQTCDVCPKTLQVTVRPSDR